MRGFPWIKVLVGAGLAAPKAIVPLLLTIAEGLLKVFVALAQWVGGLF